MKKLTHQFLFAFALLFGFTFIVNAQTQTAPAKDEQPKIIKAVAPAFSTTEDLRIRGKNGSFAFGKVVVEIEIDSDGNVVSAEAVSGHPTLRSAAESAAKKWQFESMIKADSNRKAKVVFNFQPEDDEKKTGVFFTPPLQIEIRVWNKPVVATEN